MRTADFIRQVEDTVERYGLLTPGDRVVAAVSGGADSCALALVLHALQSAYGLSLHLAHLNHGLRGEAAADAAFCREFARRLGLPFSGGEADVAARARREKTSLEAAARAARYEFLESVRQQVHADRIAVGHTVDDLTETFFLNLFRGSGLDGLTALRPRREDGLIRPLLECTHRQAEAYCRQRGVAWREDASNVDVRFRRNQVRVRLLPLIRQAFCPDVARKVGRLCALLRDDRDELDTRARELLHPALTPLSGGGVEVEGAALLAAPPALARRMVREAVATAAGNRHNTSWQHVDQCLHFLRHPRGSRTVPFPGVRCVVESSQRIRILPLPVEEETGVSPFRIAVPVPGAVALPKGGLDLVTRVIPRPEKLVLSRPAGEVFLDADRVGSRLWMRSLRPGDRMRPLGMTGTKKLSDLLIDAKVPRRERSQVAVVENEHHIVLVVGSRLEAGLRLDDRVKVTPGSRRILVVRAELRRENPPCPDEESPPGSAGPAA